MMVGSDSLPAAPARAIATALGASLDWWRLAGVDCDYADAPRDWLAAASPPPVRKAAPQPAEPARAALALPDTLDAFHHWWRTAPELGPVEARVDPAGPAAAPLMVVVPMPEPGDGPALLGGPSGRLLDAFLAAAGLSRGGVYCTAALPSRIAAPDWQALGEAGIGAALARHVTLVAPERLVIFGQGPVSTLLGHASPHNPAGLPSFNHDRGTVPALWAYDLEAVLLKPALKAGWWRRWLEWWPAAGATDGISV